MNRDMPPAQPPSQPDNQYPQPAPQHDPARYEFIMSPGQPGRRGLLPGGAPNVRMLALVGGAVVAIIILFVVIASLLGGGKSDSSSLVLIAERQAELARVAQLGSQNAVSQDTQNFAANAGASLTTSEQNMLAYLKQNGVKLSNKQLLLKMNSKTDAALTAAKESGTYDSTFVSEMQSELTSYQAALNTAEKSAAGKTEKQVLNDAINGAVLLLKQSAQHS
jgi:hypothetical protein